MKKIGFSVLVSFFLTLIPLCLNADTGNVQFVDQKGVNAVFSSEQIKSLKLKVILPKPLSGYKFDFIQVVVSPSYNPKMEWRTGWMLNELKKDSLSDIQLVPKSSLINGYGTSFMVEDIRDLPSAKGYDSLTLNVAVRIYKKTGETKETKWDKDKEKYITETVFQWDEGELIAEGTASFTVPEMSADDKKSMDADKAEKLKKLNEMRKKMGKPPLTELP